MITDWKGNEIKPGMEVCIILTKRYTLHPIGIIGFMYFNPDGSTNCSVIPPNQEELGWWLGEYQVVESRGDKLGVVKTGRFGHDGEYSTYESFCPFDSPFELPFDEYRLLAIKGVSDTKD